MLLTVQWFAKRSDKVQVIIKNKLIETIKVSIDSIGSVRKFP